MNKIFKHFYGTIDLTEPLSIYGTHRSGKTTELIKFANLLCLKNNVIFISKWGSILYKRLDEKVKHRRIISSDETFDFLKGICQSVIIIDDVLTLSSKQREDIIIESHGKGHGLIYSFNVKRNNYQDVDVLNIMNSKGITKLK